MTAPTTSSSSSSGSGRTVEKEIFIATAPERVFRAFTEQADLEQWFVTTAEVEQRIGGRFNLTWAGEGAVTGEIVAYDPPNRMVFTWDEGPETGITTCEVQFLPHSDGTLLRLSHTGWGTGEDWDRLYDGVNGGWVSELQNLRRWLESNTQKDWTGVAGIDSSASTE